MLKGTFFFIVWLIPTLVLYGICAFTQWKIEWDEWSIAARAVFGVGTVGFAAYAIYCAEND